MTSSIPVGDNSSPFTPPKHIGDPGHVFAMVETNSQNLFLKHVGMLKSDNFTWWATVWGRDNDWLFGDGHGDSAEDAILNALENVKEHSLFERISSKSHVRVPSKPKPVGSNLQKLMDDFGKEE